ncbi:hypothetical protein U7230_14225 [Carboxydochorda subterranea]|uniref:Outer membrane protein beta-barrel domain-containing protein n=1 Tax=Carboxydichorda subterranea TaxID=3109565 RepID=A0ABZ1BX09_9FIRM|nr:hypothetical protein [Limnochorda sp. L945t]WRP17219.1 hypothetical protein U7230_14225 [Limnochorda sp. L945t]
MGKRVDLFRVLAVALIAVVASSGIVAAAPFAGGGFTATYQTLSVPELNQALKAAGLPEVGNAMWLLGGGGYGPLVGADGFTIGGFGAGGHVEAKASNGRTRWFDLGYGGPRVGYQRPIAGPVSLDAGLGLAFGGATLTVLEPESGKFDLSTPNQTTYTRFILGIVPDVSVSLKITPFLHLQAGAAYFWDTRAGKGWTTMRGTDPLSGAPGDALSGVQYRLALVFGPEWSRVRDGDSGR